MTTPFKGTLSDNDISLLREFVVVVQSQGISAAEARLNKGKSAISLNLKKLETRLGMTLCLRGRGGFSLTEQGQITLSAATQLLAELDRFGEHIAGAFETLSGSVGFIADDSFLYSFQAPIATAIHKLATQHPRLQLDYNVASPEQVLNSVLDGATDIGLTAAARRTELVSYTPIFVEKMALYCGVGHPLFNQGGKLSLKDLASHKAIETYIDPTPLVRDLYAHMSFSAKSPAIFARIHMILSGAYIGFLPLDVAKNWEDQGLLREVRLPASRFENQCYLIRRKSDPEKPGSRILRELLLEEARSFSRTDSAASYAPPT